MQIECGKILLDIPIPRKSISKRFSLRDSRRCKTGSIDASCESFGCWTAFARSCETLSINANKGWENPARLFLQRQHQSVYGSQNFGR